MNTTTYYAKNSIVYGIFFLPALAVATMTSRLDGGQSLLAVLAAAVLALGALVVLRRKDDLVHDLFLPILLFSALGGMSWAVRGSAGYGSVKGCVFAGVLWGAAWWFISRNPAGSSGRRYGSGWVILALTLGIGLAGARGWAQWSNFFDGVLLTNTDLGESVPIAPIHGYVWLFIAGVPWAGIGACLLAWTATDKPLAAWQWSVRLACAFGGAFFASWLFREYPQWFLPLYGSLKERYADLVANPNLGRLINDNGNAIQHLGFYLGCLLFEIGRRDLKNVILILTVGLLNGLGWSLLQNWDWAETLWPGMANHWRGWESTSGISIGIALGIAYYLVNRRTAPCECAPKAKSGFPVFRVASMIFLSIVLLWYLIGNGADLVGEDWATHLTFCLVLLYGLAMYFWKLRASLVAGGPVEAPVITPMKTWTIHFGFMLITACFIAAFKEITPFESPDAPAWARFDYYLIGATALYGVLYLLTAGWKILTVRPGEEATIEPFFRRYPNLDWLAVYLTLTLIACALLRGELPAWQGWFWFPGNASVWSGLLLPAALVCFGLAWCALSYFAPRPGGTGLDAFAVQIGLLLGLGMSLKNGTRGWAHNNLEGNEHVWGELYWRYIGPAMLVLLVVLMIFALARRLRAHANTAAVPGAFLLVAFAVVHQNVLAHLVTGPYTDWNEMVFNLYYLLLFLLSAVVLYHYHFLQTWVPFLVADPAGTDEELNAGHGGDLAAWAEAEAAREAAETIELSDQPEESIERDEAEGEATEEEATIEDATPPPVEEVAETEEAEAVDQNEAAETVVLDEADRAEEDLEEAADTPVEGFSEEASVAPEEIEIDDEEAPMFEEDEVDAEPAETEVAPASDDTEGEAEQVDETQPKP